MKTKVVKFNNKEASVREFKVGQIKELFDMPEEASMIDRLEFMLDLCSDVKIEDLYNLTPSEIKPIIDGLLEVNESFFDQAEAVGMAQAAKAIKQLIGSLSMIAFVISSRQDTDKKSGTIPIPSSLEQ